jgi:hypothetical protein
MPTSWSLVVGMLVLRLQQQRIASSPTAATPIRNEVIVHTV